MHIGIAADHGGFALKGYLSNAWALKGYTITDFGAYELNIGDDYPDFIIPLAHAVASGKIARAVAICGSGIGASIVANKVSGVRAAIVHDVFCAHQGVEDDNMNIACLGGKVIGQELALELMETFLKAEFSGAPRHQRRIAKGESLGTDTFVHVVS